MPVSKTKNLGTVLSPSGERTVPKFFVPNLFLYLFLYFLGAFLVELFFVRSELF